MPVPLLEGVLEAVGVPVPVPELEGVSEGVGVPVPVPELEGVCVAVSVCVEVVDGVLLGDGHVTLQVDPDRVPPLRQV